MTLAASRRQGGDASGGAAKRKLVTGGAVAVAALLAWWIAGAVIPRWWAQRLGDAIDGRLTFGTFLGVACGFVFAAAPLLVLWAGWRWRRGWREGGWKRIVAFVAVAALVAAPNLATLGIVVGSGNAAHAGERILDVEGPGFRGGSVVGGLLAAVAIGGVVALASSRRRNKRRADDYRRELRGTKE